MVAGAYFLISQFPKRHAQTGQHLLGNWKMVTGTYFPSQFPKRFQPIWLSAIWEIGKLGNEYMYILPNFPISQFPKRSQPIWLSTIWEIGKLGNEYRYILPNFPISQMIPAQMAQHHLGTWEIGRGMYFLISQKTPAQMGQHFLGNWEPLPLNSCNLNPWP